MKVSKDPPVINVVDIVLVHYANHPWAFWKMGRIVHLINGCDGLLAVQHYMRVWIYNIFTADQMWCKCVSKYGICDINTIVNIKDSFTIVLMSHIRYFHTHLHHI